MPGMRIDPAARDRIIERREQQWPECDEAGMYLFTSGLPGLLWRARIYSRNRMFSSVSAAPVIGIWRKSNMPRRTEDPLRSSS